MGSTWAEPGYSATDTEDGTITGSVTTTGSVDTSTAGVYQLVYDVVDSFGAPAARKIRTVVVSPTGYLDLQNLTYTYDNTGNITQIVDTSNTNSSKTANYVYDDLNRLTSATITAVASGQSTYTHTFTYDAIGNISTGPIGSYTYAGTSYANPHAATTINGVTYSYDNDGNVSGNGTLSNTWNYKDQLTQVVVGGVTNTYAYDQAGERASSSNGTTTVVYPNDFYNTDGAKITKDVYDSNGNLVATLETISGTVTPYYDHTDNLGSITSTSSSSGTLVETLDYFPYGNQRISSGSHTDQRQYIGQIYDSGTGLDYLNARYYKADIGRFISEDPMFWSLSMQLLVDPQQQNSYSYARNNPINMKDPSGNQTLMGAIKSAINAIKSIFNKPSTGGTPLVYAPKPESNSTQKSLPTTAATTSTTQSNNNKFASVAETLVGKPYMLGANGPGAVDCSGAIVYSIRQSVNQNFGDHTADDLYRNYSLPTNSDDHARGTVIFYDYTSDKHIDHVTTNVGNNLMVHPSSGKGVVELQASTYLNSYTNKQGGTIEERQLDWDKIKQGQ